MTTEYPTDIEAYARSAAAMLAIEIAESDWPAVLANMESIFAVAQVLLAEPIPDEVAVSPVFEA